MVTSSYCDTTCTSVELFKLSGGNSFIFHIVIFITEKREYCKYFFFHYRAAQTLGTLAIICCGSVITFYLMSYLGQLDIIEKARSHLSRVRCCCWQIKSCIYIKKYSSVNPHEFPYNHWQFLMHYKLFKRLLYTPVELLYNQHSFLHYSWATSV